MKLRGRILPLIYLWIFILALILDFGPWVRHPLPYVLTWILTLPVSSWVSGSREFQFQPITHSPWAGKMQDVMIGAAVNTCVLLLLNLAFDRVFSRRIIMANDTSTDTLEAASKER